MSANKPAKIASLIDNRPIITQHWTIKGIFDEMTYGSFYDGFTTKKWVKNGKKMGKKMAKTIN